MSENEKNISPKAIQEQLSRILKTEEFRRGSRMADFLKYVVEKSLAGEKDKIKGYTIGLEVFNKPEGFDPDNDATVRVEATRLRKNLSLYYLKQGKTDPVVISIPKGSYVPKFEKQHQENPKIGYIKSHKKLALASMLIATICLTLLFSHYVEEHKEYKGPIKPAIAVLPFQYVGDAKTQDLAVRFAFSLTENLNKFSSIRTLNIKEAEGFSNWEGRASDIGQELDAEYMIEGHIRKGTDNKYAVNVQLLDTQNTTYSWSDSGTLDIEPDVTDEEIELVTGRISSELASPYGVIQSIEQQRAEFISGIKGETYRCILDYYIYSNNKSDERHKQVRNCLEHIVWHDPENAEAWAYLSWIYGNEIRYNQNPLKGEVSAYERALDAATKAVEADPKSDRAHQYMALAAMLNKNNDLARHHTLMSLSLNPNDSEILADAAWNFGQMGEWEKAAEYAKRAVEINPSHPRWYHGILFAYYYLKDDYERALSHAIDSYQPEVLSAHLALIAVYAKLGRMEEAQKHIDIIYTKFPEFKENPQKVFGVWNFQNDFNQKFLQGLIEAGMPLQTK